MKKISNTSLAFLIILGTVIVSCKKDDISKENSNNILGTWEAKSKAKTNCTSDSDNSLETLICNSTTCLTYIFEKDTSGNQLYTIKTVKDGIETNESGDFKISGDKLELCVEEEDNITCTSYNLRIDNSTLDIYTNDSDTGCKDELILEKM